MMHLIPMCIIIAEVIVLFYTILLWGLSKVIP